MPETPELQANAGAPAHGGFPDLAAFDNPPKRPKPELTTAGYTVNRKKVHLTPKSRGDQQLRFRSVAISRIKHGLPYIRQIEYLARQSFQANRKPSMRWHT
jgi:hypothetical protein